MSEDWVPDEVFVQHVLDELVPMVEDSALTLSIVPKKATDVKFAVELGVTLMLDKPLILAVFPGVPVPEHLRRAADAIVEFDPDDMDSTQRRVTEAMDKVVGKH